eukprot:4079007-Prymnesium_polylepis.1
MAFGAMACRVRVRSTHQWKALHEIYQMRHPPLSAPHKPPTMHQPASKTRRRRNIMHTPPRAAP